MDKMEQYPTVEESMLNHQRELMHSFYYTIKSKLFRITSHAELATQTDIEPNLKRRSTKPIHKQTFAAPAGSVTPASPVAQIGRRQEELVL
jgi:hypothetical protein